MKYELFLIKKQIQGFNFVTKIHLLKPFPLNPLVEIAMSLMKIPFFQDYLNVNFVNRIEFDVKLTAVSESL